MSSHSKSRVVIIGRPNVGKSSLFNALVGRRQAMVKNRPGVTRDLIISDADAWGREFEVIDTGGLTDVEDAFSPLIQAQVRDILSTADLLLVVTDGRAGLCPEDEDVIRLTLESGKEALLVVNKVDKDSQEAAELAKSDFYRFGLDTVGVSCEKKRGIDEVAEWIRPRIKAVESSDHEGIVLAITGKPNVGKSSLVNYLLGENRMLVSSTAGTTIDAIDAPLSYAGTNFILVDTAGLRRQARRHDELEKLAAIKSKDSIERANIILLMVDVREGPTDQDARLLQDILLQGKAVLLVANKADIADSGFRQRFREQCARVFHFFPDIKIAFISAKTGSGVEKLFQQINEVWAKVNIRIPTSQLNDFFMNVIRQAPAPVYRSKNVKFYYLTQTRQKPPSFIAFANHPEGITPAYRRFLMKRIQENWDIKGVPVRIFAMKKGGREKAAR